MMIEREMPSGYKVKASLTQEELMELYGACENAAVQQEAEMAFRYVNAEKEAGGEASLEPLTELEMAEIVSQVIDHRQTLYDESEVPIVRAEVRNTLAKRELGKAKGIQKGCQWCTVKGYPRIEFSPIDADGERLTDGYVVQTELARYCPYCGRKLPKEYTV